ncbi:MAG: outer membrane protein assembly factor BamD [Candidatus Omnitrophica bacterium]|jgi:outer membrane protein assembly factor BamD (BamD/ComL family)|nr:outer membrane protein assembly factor BamD [Candidatus Omnitrophota bacterium]
MQAKTLLFTIVLLTFAHSAYPYWIWTPQTKKWVNPKSSVKDTPKDQFAAALALYEIKNYDEADREFKKLIKNYPKAAEAAESQYYLGLIQEAKNNLYEAFLAYQKVIDKYPFSQRIQEIIQRQYNIGEIFLSGEKRKLAGLPIPVENPAIEIFAKVVENSNYGPLAAKAEYKLGLVLKELLRYFEAEEAFNKVISSYPNSEWAPLAQYQIAQCRAAVSRGPQYDQGAAGEAKEKFEEFVRDHPDAVLSKEAEANIAKIKLKEAESNYQIASFYEKQKAYQSARIYYQNILDTYSQTEWAKKAEERLKQLEAKK